MAERAQYTQEEQSAIRDAVTGGEQPLCPRCEVVMTARPGLDAADRAALPAALHGEDLTGVLSAEGATH